MATEKRLIDKWEVIKLLRGKWIAKYPVSFYFGLIAAADEIEKLPEEDAVEVVHGEWTIIEDGYCCLIGLECPHCEKTWWFDEESPIREYHYCPGCGADMRERKDNVL